MGRKYVEVMVREMRRTTIWILAALLLMTAAIHAAAEQAGTAQETPRESVQAAEAVEEAVELGLYSQGAQVKDLQRRLYVLGFYTGSADGIYGNNTYNAIKEFEEYVRCLEQSVLDSFEPHFVVIQGLHGDTLETLAQQFGFEVYRY